MEISDSSDACPEMQNRGNGESWPPAPSLPPSLPSCTLRHADPTCICVDIPCLYKLPPPPRATLPFASADPDSPSPLFCLQRTQQEESEALESIGPGSRLGTFEFQGSWEPTVYLERGQRHGWLCLLGPGVGVGKNS